MYPQNISRMCTKKKETRQIMISFSEKIMIYFIRLYVYINITFFLVKW